MQSQDYTRIPISQGDSRFPSFQQGFNRRWFAAKLQDRYLCSNAAGTRAALDDAISRYGNQIAIVSGGHCYENFVYGETTRALIDVTPMNGVGVDPQRGFYLEAGGSNWSAFQALFRNFGRVLPAGSCYSVGLGGHICGGGYGLLSRMYGLTVDWLSGVEIVVKDSAKAPARVLYVSNRSKGDEFDLYWAQCGGGGGNFGVITKYYFADLPPAPKSAVISVLAFDWSDLTAQNLGELLAWYAELAARTDNGEVFGLFKLQHQAAGEIQLVLQIARAEGREAADKAMDSVAALQKELHGICRHRPIRRPVLGHPGWFTIAPEATLSAADYTFYEAVQTLNGSGPNQRGKYKSAYMRKAFPADQVDAIYANLKRIPAGLSAGDMIQSLLQVDTYGAAINSKSPTETAIAQRSSIMKLQYQTYWQHPDQDAAQLDWIRRFYSEVYAQTGGTPNPALDPSDNVDGCYYNYPDTDLNDLVGREGALQLYFLDNFRTNPRNLVAVKQRWDPNNYFHSAQSIPVE